MISTLDAAFWITSGAILILLVFSAFFSGSETALTAASRGKLRSDADKGSKGAERALEVTDDSERLIDSVLLGNNLVNILATSLATAMFTRMFGQNGVALATLVMTILVLVFAEVLPKTYAITDPERAAARVARPIAIIVKVLSPFVNAVRALVRGVLRLFGVRINPDSPVLAMREEIAGAITLGHSEGIVEKDDRDRILGALDLSDVVVEEIMLHRSGIAMIDAAMPMEDLLAKCLEGRHSRLPVYANNPDNIVGILHIKDLLRSVHRLWRNDKIKDRDLQNFDIMSVVTEPYFVPETTPLDDQMRQFLRRKSHFALVVDEYGDLQGLITLEDILEEIVGEITDEFDDVEDEAIERTDDGAFIVDGTMTIRDLNRAHDWHLPDEEANTIAGLVIHEAQMIPAMGQVFSFHGFRFEVVTKDQNRVVKLKVWQLPKSID